MDRLEVVQPLAVNDMDAVPPDGDFIEVRAAPGEGGTISRTVSRVTPGRFVEVHGVTIVELRMMKKFSAVASDTYPWMSSIKASSAPYWFASTRAMMLFR